MTKVYIYIYIYITAFLPWRSILEGLRTSRRAAPKVTHYQTNTSVLLFMDVKDSDNPLLFEMTGSRGKINNTSGVSQNAEAAAGLALKCLKRLHS